METRIEQWGDTLAVRIPPELANQLGFNCGDAVNLQSCGYGLTVIPSGAPPAELAELVSRITDENRHEEISWGPPVGREVW